MSFVKIPVKGMRDILPSEMELREYIISQIYETYKLFGFKKIETPCVEHIENISNNQGGENEKLTFKILKRGEKFDLDSARDIFDIVDCGLRYDLTVPLSRYYSNNMNDLDRPFKALQIGNVWRADRPQKGRFRQFVQCDIDILGEKSIIAEIELVLATTTLLNKVGLNNYTVKINDRRILKAIAAYSGFNEEEYSNLFISLDKLDKIGFDGVKEELISDGFESNKIDKYLNIFKNIKSTAGEFCKEFNSSIDQEVINDLDKVIDVVKNINNINIEFDPTLVRGMSYYTGIIFEITVEGYPGSIAGGGRYDEMIGRFINVPVPACGFSIGFERLINILTEKGFEVPSNNKKYAMLIDKDTDSNKLKEYIKEANDLRKDGYEVNVLNKSKNYKYQIETLENNNYTIIKK